MNDFKTKLNYNIRRNSLGNKNQLKSIQCWSGSVNQAVLLSNLKVFVIHPVMDVLISLKKKKFSVLTKILIGLGSKMLNNTLK